MDKILGESETEIVFGDFYYGVLRNKVIYASLKFAKDFAEKLLKTEHAVKELKDQFWWPGIDPISELECSEIPG